jgi:hypothetical protein
MPRLTGITAAESMFLSLKGDSYIRNIRFGEHAAMGLAGC